MKFALYASCIGIVCVLLSLPAQGSVAASIERPLDVYLFWAEGCPHCEKEIDFLRREVEKMPAVNLHYLEVTRVFGNRKVFIKLIRHFGIERPVVPLTVIGENYFQGFDDISTTGKKIQAAIETCLQLICPDIVKPLQEGEGTLQSQEQVKHHPEPPKILKLPMFGELSLDKLSLPVLTVLLAAVDGFNPCAMWTLVFLISLLIGLRDHFRMWALGSLFIIASATVYFLFMAAWLNLLLFLGMLLWIRLSVGLIALGGGGYYIHEYFTNPEASCKVTSPDTRRRTFERLRLLTEERNFLLAAAGIIMLAFVVNLIELICSAGIPAVYTQVLAMSNLPEWQYYLYLCGYIFIFMLDDLFVFFVAMKTLQVTGLTGAYVRHAHAIGGVILIMIGLMLLFKPEWLTFAA